jgi:DNA polymerase-1
MLQTTAKGYMPLLQVHDELHFETDPEKTPQALVELKEVLENIVKLDVPLTANGGWGRNWFEAK